MSESILIDFAGATFESIQIHLHCIVWEIIFNLKVIHLSSKRGDIFVSKEIPKHFLREPLYLFHYKNSAVSIPWNNFCIFLVLLIYKSIEVTNAIPLKKKTFSRWIWIFSCLLFPHHDHFARNHHLLCLFLLPSEWCPASIQSYKIKF